MSLPDATITEEKTFTIQIGDVKFERLEKGESWNGFVEYKGRLPCGSESVSLIVNEEENGTTFFPNFMKMFDGEAQESKGSIVKASQNVIDVITAEMEKQKDGTKTKKSDTGKGSGDG